eukprot:Nitzschia sp. Nitz4//scaffold6_size259037//104667//106142//NITZ4_001068-RA/size259037-processed-gene-0.14-mRNA-1//1//CDS//3329556875//6267//frame0
MLDIDSKGKYQPLAGKNQHLVTVATATAQEHQEEGPRRGQRRLHVHDIISFGPSDEPWCRFQVISSPHSGKVKAAATELHGSSSTFLVRPSTKTPQESTYVPRVLLHQESDDTRDPLKGQGTRVVEHSSFKRRKRERGGPLPVVKQDFQTSARLVCNSSSNNTERKEDADTTKCHVDNDLPKWVTPSPKKKQRIDEQGSSLWRNANDECASPLGNSQHRCNLATDLQLATEMGPQLETQEEYGTNALIDSSREATNVVQEEETANHVGEDLQHKKEAPNTSTMEGGPKLDTDMDDVATTTSQRSFLSSSHPNRNRWCLSSSENMGARGLLGQRTSQSGSQMPPPFNKQPQQEVALSLTPLQQESNSQENSVGDHSLSLPMCASSLESGQQDDALLNSVAAQYESQHSPVKTVYNESQDRSTEQPPPNPLTSVQPWHELKQREENQGTSSSVRHALASLLLARNAQHKDNGSLLWLPTILSDGLQLPLEKKG